ncbi:MAG TPA: hypothetical protein VJA40_01575, partial [archaeon]|nr:hypothetical protein [archaeon]
MSKPLFFAASLAFLASTALGHGAEDVGVSTETLFPVDPAQVLVYTSVISGLAIIAALIFRDAAEHHKKALFLAIAVPVALSTLYLAGTTVYLNLVSETGGPVHWHADYEVWDCGKQVTDFLESETVWDNKVGSPTIHHHGDYRMHIEGVLLRVTDARIHNFFEKIGGEYDEGSFSYVDSAKAVKRLENGDLCPNGKPGAWKLYVQDGPKKERKWRLETQGPNYVIQPFADVPPGDFLKLVFDSEDDESKMKAVVGN